MDSEALPENFKAPKAFPYWESKLVEHVGRPRERLVEFRAKHLAEGVDFVREKNHVVLSYAGARAMLAALGLTLDEADRVLGVIVPADPEKRACEAGKPVLVLKVHPRKTLNPHVLLVTDGKSVLRLRVRTKEHFRAGMDVHCQQEHGDLYTLVGNHPRYPGKF